MFISTTNTAAAPLSNRPALTQALLRILARNPKFAGAEILREVCRIYGMKHLERVRYTRPEGLEEAIQAPGKAAAAAQQEDFIGDRLPHEWEQEGLFGTRYPEVK